MAVTYLDQEIESLVQERKPAPADWRNRIRLKPKRGHDEEQLDLTGDAGNEFRLIFRQNKINPLDFSVILAVRVPGSSQIFRLRRYNGKSTNTPTISKTSHFMIFIFTLRRSGTRSAEHGRTPTPSRPIVMAISMVPFAV